MDEQQEKLNRLEETVAEQEQRIEKIESENEILKRHVDLLISGQDDHEQYSRRLCLCIDGMELPPPGEDETSEQCLDKVLKILEKMDVQIPNSVIDRAHRIGRPKKPTEPSGKVTQQIISRFTSWRHKTMVYRARKKASKHIKFRLDLTKKRLNLLIPGNEILKPHRNMEGHIAREAVCGATISCKIVEPLRKNKVFCPPPPIAMLIGNKRDFSVGS